ncbi:MAG: MBOAT family protein [Burkholderiaceae bacterium]|nr:MBOAT family protein [Burkholderiaceae bacterium]
MLFNSYEFVLIYLPLVTAVFFLLGRRQWHELAITWLVLASLFFYGWWNPRYLILIVVSMVLNFWLGTLLSPGTGATAQPRVRKALLIVGVTANLASIAYFKYAGFVVETINRIAGTSLHLDPIVLPLAISFFTFQQIAYLVDVYRDEARESGPIRYALFVTFFPQLIAGPIVHHKEMLPQFRLSRIFRFDHRCMAIGSSIFVLGLFKKVVIADTFSGYAAPMFDAAQRGDAISFFEAWAGTLAYTFQLYFDFSGYSDMAIGLAAMFGIRLPLNFFSPYKAVNIVEFWRRWHITLSRFLRDYLYIPLGGSRRGPRRHYLNLFVTMLLGGLWHGAGWTFVAWGALHGLYLAANHLWHGVRRRLGLAPGRHAGSAIGRVAGVALTFLCVVVGWVFFRSQSFPAALTILAGMAGLNGFVLPDWYALRLDRFGPVSDWLIRLGWRFEKEVPHLGGLRQLTWLAIAAAIVWFAPNTHQLMRRWAPGLDPTGVAATRPHGIPIRWQPGTVWALLSVGLLLACLNAMDGTSEFLYYQF